MLTQYLFLPPQNGGGGGLGGNERDGMTGLHESSVESKQTATPLRGGGVSREDIASLRDQCTIVDDDNEYIPNNNQVMNLSTETNIFFDETRAKWIRPMVCPHFF